MPNSEYDRKRDFSKTPEPAFGPGDASGDELRFVVQEHHATRLHWDLRLERDGALVSFAVPNGLPPEPGRNNLAVRTEDHPLEYLTFHGEIPKGNYGAGSMTIWDHGTYEVLKWDEGKKIEVHLHGERVDARYALFPISKEQPLPKDWMVHRMDPADDADAEPMPERFVPMLAKAGKLPSGDDWAFEFKWDGIRAVAHSEPGNLRFHTRNLNDVTKRYPELSKLNRALSHHRAILDGEIVAFADGRPSFSALQRRMHLASESAARRLAKDAPVTYVVFDLLWLDGHSLMGLPYAERRTRLEALDLNGDRWQTPPHVVGNGQAVLQVAEQQGLEGVMAKKLDCPYEPGRRANGWIKVKLLQRQEMVIGGWLPGEGRRRDRIGALLLGVMEGTELRYVGRVGTGFTQDELDMLASKLGPCERDDSPFTGGPKPPKGSVFVHPHYLAEVEFTEWTPDGVVRHPSYKGLRDDKPPVEVVREDAKAALLAVEGVEVKLSNPTKALWPNGFTKRDLVDYYVAIAPALLPHLQDRQLTLKRYPNGAEGEFFYEKNAPGHRPDWVTTSGGFVVADSLPTLVWLANLADIELHTPMARADALGTPTILAFDLDPGPGAGLKECAQVGLWLRGMLGGLGLQCFPKTSGSKGMQVYVPLNHPDTTHGQTKTFAKLVAELLEREAPELVVSKQTKTLRAGKVLVDWSQNDEHKTTVCVYSPRAKDRPTVSTPLTWEEVEQADPRELEFTTDQVLERVARDGDLFAPVVSLVQALPKG